MKILHVSFYDQLGGAARAMFRIHQSLIAIGVDSNILVIKKFSSDDKVFPINDNLINKIHLLKIKIFNQIKKIFFDFNNNFVTFGVFSNKSIINQINSFNSDVVNFHWVGGEMISYKEAINIESKIIWTLHDMSLFLGISHYSLENKKYLHHFFEKIFLNHKKKIFKNATFSLILPSKWMLDKVKKQSTININKSIVINYPIDLKIFKYNLKTLSKQKLRLDQNISYLLFVSNSISTEHRKGYSILNEIISLNKNFFIKNNINFLIIGSDREYSKYINDVQILYKKRIDDNSILNLYYSSSELTLMPTLIDNYPLVMQESLASGTPIISFNNGGMSDLIINGFNGYLSDMKINGLLENIKKYYLLEPKERDQMSLNCVNSIKKDSFEIIGKQTLKFYQDNF